jgi:hypothetical protein
MEPQLESNAIGGDPSPMPIGIIDDGLDPIIVVVNGIITVAKFFYRIHIPLPLVCAGYGCYVLYRRYLRFHPPSDFLIPPVHFVRQVVAFILRLPSGLLEVIHDIFFTDGLAETPLPLWGVRFSLGFIHGWGSSLENLFEPFFSLEPAPDQGWWRGPGGLPTPPPTPPPDSNPRQGQEQEQGRDPRPSFLLNELHMWYSYIRPVLLSVFLYLLIWFCVYLFSEMGSGGDWAAIVTSWSSSSSMSDGYEDGDETFAHLRFDDWVLRGAAGVAALRTQPRYRVFANGTRALMPEL